jgi:hypothetical protein
LARSAGFLLFPGSCDAFSGMPDQSQKNNELRRMLDQSPIEKNDKLAYQQRSAKSFYGNKQHVRKQKDEEIFDEAFENN